MIGNSTGRPWNLDQALAYLRCSKDEQTDSIEGQRRIVEGALAAQGMRLLQPAFVDDGRRGSDEERPGLLALLEYCRRHPVRIQGYTDYVPIFIQAIDRMGRFLDPMKIFTYLNELKGLGYDVYSVSERMRYVSGNIGDWIQIVVRSDQATGYSIRLSHDSLRGGLQTAEKGHLAGGSPGYAYDRVVVGPDGKPKNRYTSLPGKRVAKYTMDGQLVCILEPVVQKGKLVSPSLDKSNCDHVERVLGDPLKVKAVQRIWELYVDERRGFRTIADTLNREGYPPPRGTRWLTSSIRGILTNPIYMGTGTYGRRSKSKFHRFSVENGGAKPQFRIDRKEIFQEGSFRRKLDECLLREDAHPAIIPKERWHRAQELLASRAAGQGPRRTGRGARSSYLLSGFVKCARCGYSFQGDTHRKTGWRSYQCGGYVSGGKSVCLRQTVPADRIEGWVIDEIRDRLYDGRAGLFTSLADLESEIQAEVTSQFRSSPPRENERKALETRISEKKRKIEIILTGLAEDNLDVANDAIRPLKREIAGLEEQLRKSEAPETPRLQVDPKALAREAANYLWNLKEVLNHGTVEEQRRFVEYFLEGVKINGLEGWVEASFYEPPTLPGVSFCMAPPTGFEPVLRT